MNRIKINFSLVFMALMFVPLLATAKTTTRSSNDFLCVSVEVPEFMLVPDSTCAISESNVTQTTLPDQDLLYDLGYPASATCFRFANPNTGEEKVDGVITYQGLSLNIKVDGIAGFTFNNYPTPYPAGVTPYTAISLANIYYSPQWWPNNPINLGSLLSRDSGTIVDGVNIGGRLSIAKGTGFFTNVVGYIDEFGSEFSSAQGIGKLCFPLNNGGNSMSNKTSNERKSDILNKLFNPILPARKIESKLF